MNTQNIWPTCTSLNKQPVLLPVRLEDICSIITSDYKRSSKQAILASTSPNKLSLRALCRLGCQLSWGSSTSIYYSGVTEYPDRPSWPTSPYKLSSFVSVRLPVRLGIIKSQVQKYNKKTNERLSKVFVELSNCEQCKFG